MEDMFKGAQQFNDTVSRKGKLSLDISVHKINDYTGLWAYPGIRA